MKEAAVYIKKCIFFTLESAHGFAYRQPVVAGFMFFFIFLHTCCPNLFAFLVSSSPVLVCTALLLGTLLSYGEPYLPEIEEREDELNCKVSSLKLESSLDDLFLKKDKNYTLEGIVDSTDFRNERLSDVLAEEQDEFEEDCILERGFEENVGDLMKELHECRAGSINELGSSKEPELDEWLESSLGSPWHPINMHDAASDSESDRAESSSSDASMADILPMLNELHPLLDSKAPKVADNSDAELCKHHESDEESTEQEDDTIMEESGASNKVVTWTADDQKNVMDLGSSDQERNRRLESLIARRRARKNQIIIFERDLIDLHGNNTTVDELFRFHPRIPHISAPRMNPFDLGHDSDESEGYPPIPGSAPSVLLHGKNPFDFSYDTENGDSQGLAEDNSGQTEFGLPSRRGLSFRRYESFASGSSRLNPYLVGETMDIKHNDLTEFEPNEETHQGVNDYDDFKKEIEGTLSVEEKHGVVVEEKHGVVVEEKHGVVVEEKHEEWSQFTSSEDNEKSLDVILPEELENKGRITTFIEGNSQAYVPIYDFSPSGSGNFFADVYVPDDTFFYSGRGVPNSTYPVESNVQEHIMEAVLHERDFGEDMTSKMMEFEVFHRSKLQDQTSSSGELVAFTSNINLMDEDMFQSKGVSEEGEQDFPKNRYPAHEDFDHSSSFSSRESDLNEPCFAFYSGLFSSDVEDKHQSLEKLEARSSFGILLEESRISNLELGPILEESLEDFMVEEEQVDFPKSNVGEKAIYLHSQMKEAAGGNGNEEEIELFPENSKPSKISNIFDGMEYSNLYRMKTDNEFKSNDGISDARAIDINEFQLNQDATLINLNEFYGVPDEDDVREMQCFDEQFLSELDAVGDFHMESQSSNQLDCSSKDSKLVLNEKPPKDSGIWSFARSHGEDLELTVYKPKLSVLQSCSLEEFDSTFIENSPGEFELSVSEASTHNFELEKPHGGLSSSEMPGQGIEAVTHDATLLTLNETIENADSDFGHAPEIIHSMSISSLVNTESSNSHANFEQMKSSSPEAENSSELSVLEAKSSEDMQLTFQQATEVKPYEDLDSTFEQFDNEKMVTGSNAELETDVTGPINSENDAKPLAFEKMTFDVNSDFELAHTMSLESKIVNERQIDLEPPVLDSKFAEDTNLNPALEQDVDAAEKNSLSAEDKPEMFATESFEDTHLELREAAADGFCQSTTILVNHGRNLGQQLLFEKSTDSGNDSDIHVTEAKSLEDFNLPFKQSAEDYDTVKESHLASVAEEKPAINIQTTFTTGVYEGLSSVSDENRPYYEVETESGILIMESKNVHDISSNCKLATNAGSFDTESVPNSLVLEEENVKLTDSTSKQVSEESRFKPILYIDPPALQVNKDEFMEENSHGKNDSELLVLEENFAKDIYSTLKQATEEQLGWPVALQADSKTETHSEHANANVESSNEEQMNTITDEEVIVSEDSSSSAPTGLNMKKFKKKKENKSDSSSSSSDSD